MEFHPAYGVGIPEKNWVPAPRYLLRRDRLLSLLRTVAPGAWLEIGCGAGALLYDLAQRGFSCSALEHADDAAMLADAVRRHYNFGLHIYRQPDSIPSEHFDCIGAFEVLEHCEDDVSVLRQWSHWLRSGGLLFMSVPAHARKWSATDTWAGHCRRYEKNQLAELLGSSGLVVTRIESYGFPLANLLDPFRARMHAAAVARAGHRGGSHERDSATLRSGTDRRTETGLYPLLKSPAGRLLMGMAFRLQRLFLDRDLGNGYLAVARKP